MSKKSTEKKNGDQNENRVRSIRELLAEQREYASKKYREEWWSENWISFCGLIATVVVAIAAIVGAVASVARPVSLSKIQHKIF